MEFEESSGFLLLFSMDFYLIFELYASACGILVSRTGNDQGSNLHPLDWKGVLTTGLLGSS